MCNLPRLFGGGQQDQAATPPIIAGPTGGGPDPTQAQPGPTDGSYYPGAAGTPPAQPIITHSKFGNLLRFLNNPIRDSMVGAMVGASALQPSTAAGSGNWASNFAKGGAADAEFNMQQQQQARENAYRQAEEQRMQQQANEQSALAQKYLKQADQPAPLTQLGDKMYERDPVSGKYKVATDVDGNELLAPNKSAGKAVARKSPKSIPGLPGYGEDEDGNVQELTVQKPLDNSAPTSGPGAPMGPYPLPSVAEPDNSPGLSLPSVLAEQKSEAAQTKADQANQKDTKANYVQDTARDKSGVEHPIFVDKNPDSPTFGQTKPIAGVTRYPAPDTTSTRENNVRIQQGQVEEASQHALDLSGGDPDRAIQLIQKAQMPPGQQGLVMKRVREISREKGSKKKPDPTQAAIDQAMQGLNTPPPPMQ